MKIVEARLADRGGPGEEGDGHLPKSLRRSAYVWQVVEAPQEYRGFLGRLFRALDMKAPWPKGFVFRHIDSGEVRRF